MPERAYARQLTLRGFHEAAPRLRKARRALKSLTGDEKSVVLEEVWSGGLEGALRRLAQGWENMRHAFNFRVSDQRKGIYASSPEVGDLVFDPQAVFQEEVAKAHLRKLPAKTLARRYVKERPILAKELNDDVGWTRDLIAQAIELTGTVYGLQPSTVKNYQRMVYARAKRVDSRLR